MDGQIIRMKSGLGEIQIKIEKLLGFFFNLEEISPLFLKNLMPVFARGHARFSSSGNGQTGICPFDNYRATGRAGIGFFANGREKAGIGYAR